ncbi:MAG: hypothetical protein A3J58_03630 [Candidatus Sungbacteria bacterium RIFCSPHIGHO2_02_FULL_52_23]|uniref:ABC transmembrane type-1 domain-containing protein n=1 Tax=Candidatus Sungbacteria bacterium RIFCSPHIGHO2_02_FULL_52_23 TaxID=1802274 RepID=A0A1G2KYB9_9BACT|nr:MAG: hypothetical protein A3J58_03630 [Candidatus Sungbacteria bacterium RIFCSPHIGHO2_02_FULL_52_23]
MYLTVSRLKIISDIFRDIAQVFFVSVLVGPIVSGETSILIIMAGLALALGCWYTSILLQRD